MTSARQAAKKQKPSSRKSPSPLPQIRHPSDLGPFDVMSAEEMQFKISALIMRMDELERICREHIAGKGGDNGK